MDKNHFMKKLRLFLADPEGKIWDDVELGTILEEALKQYSIDSGAFTAKFDFFPDENGDYHYPDNCAGFMIGWNFMGQEITPVTARELFIRSARNAKMYGKAEFIYNDTASFGTFSLYPNPAEEQNRKTISIKNDYGEVMDSDYGVFKDDSYGVALSINAFDYAGTIYCRRIGTFEEVKDYMAVICYALHLAYCADSEFGNADTADYWKRIYRERIAVFGRISHNNTGRSKTGNFF